MKRYLITLGAPTTSGGKVTSASSFRSINGAKAALEGDTAWCPKCNSEGVISLDGPRLAETYNGKHYALNDDLCLCKCTPPPRVVAAQNLVSQNINVEWHAAKTFAAAGAAGKLNTDARSATEPNGIPLVLLDPGTDEPFKHRPYRLPLTDKTIAGTNDQNGATRSLSASERASVIT